MVQKMTLMTPSSIVRSEKSENTGALIVFQLLLILAIYCTVYTVLTVRIQLRVCDCI